MTNLKMVLCDQIAEGMTIKVGDLIIVGTKVTQGGLKQ